MLGWPPCGIKHQNTMASTLLPPNIPAMFRQSRWSKNHQTRRIPYTRTSQEHSSMKHGRQYNFTWHRPRKIQASILLLASILLPAGILLLPSRQRLVPYHHRTKMSTASSSYAAWLKIHKTHYRRQRYIHYLEDWPVVLVVEYSRSTAGDAI